MIGPWGIMRRSVMIASPGLPHRACNFYKEEWCLDMSRFTRCYALLAVFCIASSSLAQEGADVRSVGSGPFCGHYVVHAGLVALDYNPARDLIGNRKYLTAQYGSSMGDLVSAIQSYGCHADVCSHMTLQTLMLMNRPIILHLRQMGSSGYHHWGLFLGFDGDKIVVCDPPGRVIRLDIDTFLPFWDGTGVIMSREKLSGVDRVLLVIPEARLLIALVAMQLVDLLLNVRRRSTLTSLFLMTAAGVLVLAMLPISPLRHPAESELCLSYPTGWEGELIQDLPAAQQLYPAKQIVLVDARYAYAYWISHLQNSRNLPIDSTHADYRDFIANYNLNECVFVVYCQSETCNWAHEVAWNLMKLGASHIKVLHGGYIRHNVNK